MCLYATTEEPKVMEEDKHVFKALLMDDNQGLHPPFMTKSGLTYKLDIMYREVRFGVDRNNPYYSPLEKVYPVGRGFYSYTDLSCVMTAITMRGKIGCRYAICECLIPKGTRYYESEFGGYALCSEYIKVLNIIGYYDVFNNKESSAENG